MDGGLTALGGFLYQTVVALSLKEDTFQEYDDAPINKGDLETVLGFAKDGEVGYEDPRSAQREFDELIALEAFESVPDLGFARLKGESHRRKKNKTCRRWEQPRKGEAKKT